jgi:hypothetical protein
MNMKHLAAAALTLCAVTAAHAARIDLQIAGTVILGSAPGAPIGTPVTGLLSYDSESTPMSIFGPSQVLYYFPPPYTFEVHAGDMHVTSEGLGAFISHIAGGNRITSRMLGAVGEQHHQAVDADAFAAGRRQAVLERADVVGVVVHRLLVAGFLGAACARSARPGPRGRSARRSRWRFAAGDEELEAVGDPGIAVVGARERRDLDRIVAMMKVGCQSCSSTVASNSRTCSCSRPSAVREHASARMARSASRGRRQSARDAGCTSRSPRHRQAANGFAEVDRRALVGELVVPSAFARGVAQHVLGEVHQVVVVQ